jgi:hypothetical protein
VSAALGEITEQQFLNLLHLAAASSGSGSSSSSRDSRCAAGFDSLALCQVTVQQREERLHDDGKHCKRFLPEYGQQKQPSPSCVTKQGLLL